MPYIYTLVTTLKDENKVGSNECVALVQYYTNAPHSSSWKAGATVLGDKTILAGTAIATFVNGRYLSKPHGNHAAFFLRQGINGIWVMDQWKDKPDRPSRPISERFIPALKQPQHKDGSWPRASDNAKAFSVIEPR